MCCVTPGTALLAFFPDTRYLVDKVFHSNVKSATISYTLTFGYLAYYFGIAAVANKLHNRAWGGLILMEPLTAAVSGSVDTYNTACHCTQIIYITYTII